MIDRSLAVDIIMKLGIKFNATDVVEVLEMMAMDLSSQLFIRRGHDEMCDGARDRAAFDDALPYLRYAVTDHVLQRTQHGTSTAGIVATYGGRHGA